MPVIDFSVPSKKTAAIQLSVTDSPYPLAVQPDRRTIMRAIAVSVLAVTGAGSAPARADRSLPTTGRVPVPHGVLNRLPGDGNQLALTIDDGTNSEVVAAFAQFCRDSGTRLTFFPNGINSSWTVNAPALRPMVDSGQILLGNHTWSHPNLTRVGVDGVADQIRRNADFLRNTYGVDGTPYFRPPYGAHTADVDRVANDLGYPVIALWSGTIGDSRPVSEKQIVGFAQQSFQPQQIILGHANLPPITHTYSQLLDIINQRGLQTVTLADVFA
jgi:peptidoglycan/xylan/chitin deacetylase (PgdA/CDA1 family)